MDPHNPSPLSQQEIERLRKALPLKYPNSTTVLGAQLGNFIRQHLDDPNLKERFGGLKNFVTNNFPREILWLGKKALDDLYEVFLVGETSAIRSNVWQAVPQEKSSWLWSSVTNPSIEIQFGWSTTATTLMHSTSRTPLDEGMALVEKISRHDYHEIATRFANSLGEGEQKSRYLESLERSESSVAFTTLLKKEELLAKWEEIRVAEAIKLFTDRLFVACDDQAIASRWAGLLRLSQQHARAQRIQKLAPPLIEKVSLPNTQISPSSFPDSRAVATRAIQFLSEAEIEELRLPLGSVMRALRILFEKH